MAIDTTEGIKGVGRWAKWFAIITGGRAVGFSMPKTISASSAHSDAEDVYNTDKDLVGAISNYDKQHGLDAGSKVPSSDELGKIVQQDTATYDQAHARVLLDQAAGHDPTKTQTVPGITDQAALDHAKSKMDADRALEEILGKSKNHPSSLTDAHTQLDAAKTALDHTTSGTWTFISEVGHNLARPLHHPLDALVIGLAAAFAASARTIKNSFDKLR